MDLTLRIDGRELVGFVANYRAIIDDPWVEVARYDTCHGVLHVHRFWLPEESQILDLEDPFHRRKDYGEVLAIAENDLDSNWPEYRERMEVNLR